MTQPKSYGRRFLALALLTALAGCGESGGFSFASRSAETRSALPRGLTEIRMGEAPIVLAAPEGFCFDQQTLTRGDDGGFALLARCANLRPLTRHRLPLGRNTETPAVISATISPPIDGAQTPNVDALIAASAPARVLAEHPDALMPMIKIEAKAPGVPGTSHTQWRGAMVLGDRLVALSLYAPEDSDLLGPDGAKILRNMARRSDSRSRDALPVQSVDLRPTARPETHLPVAASDAAAPLRPRLRPGTEVTPTVAEAPRPKKVSRRWRIADLFN